MSKLLSEIVKEKGKNYLFPELPVEAKKALIHYYCLEMESTHEEWEELNNLGYNEDNGIDWNMLFLVFDKAWSRYNYTLYEMPTEDLVTYLMEMDDSFIKEEHESFEAYHKWYVEPSLPRYGKTERWPSIAISDDEGIWDGWHRFHSYYREGHETMPLIV